MASPIRLIVVGGFLGAGKTTTILGLAQRWVAAGKRVGIIANDQGADLVDTEIFRASNLDTSEVAGGCFCCRFDDFIAGADALIGKTRPAVILAEPVGSCTDIVATVLNPITRFYPERFQVAPYTVLVDPIRALKTLGRSERVGLSERITYIYRMQQQEADAIAISKIDQLTSSERDRVEQLILEQLPGRHVLRCSARSGEGFETLMAWLESERPDGRALRDLNYDVYAQGEAELGWLNHRVQLKSQRPIALDDVLLQLGREIQAACRARALEIAHGKLLLDADGHVAVVNMVDSLVPPEVSRPSDASSCSTMLTINLRIQSEPGVVAELVQETLAVWTRRLDLSATEGRTQCFAPSPPVPTHRVATT